MRCARLFCPNLDEGTVELPPEEARHAVGSLRLKGGAEVVLFDGAGGEADGVVARVGRHSVAVEVGAMTVRPFELAHRITLAVAMGRAQRQGYLIEKCTELGVAAIQPVIAERSVTKPGADAVGKWSRRAIEAAKQSGRAWVPVISVPCSFAESLTYASDFDASCVVHPCAVSDVPRSDEREDSVRTGATSNLPFSALLAELPDSPSVLVWVGPEGGWSDEECRQAVDAGAIAASLGPTVLRTETAAIAVCAAAALASA